MTETVIDIKNLEKYYGKHLGVSHVSLSIEKGEIFGFLGSNGAGKSTTIRCLLGLIKPTAGEIRLFGQSSIDWTEALKRIGYMPSEAHFYATMRVREVIALAAETRQKDCRQEADRLSHLLDLPLDKKIQDLSLGNRKKVSIVCAMQHRPDLLIFDEPTSGLDPLMQERFFSLVKEACAAGTTCFLSSHVLSEIKQYCDRAAIIKEGKILTVDTIDGLTHSQKKLVTIWRAGQMEQFNFTGTGGELLTHLGQLAPDDFLVEEPSLEELFMHYYEEGNHDISQT